jgi:hypothetical protein
MAALNRYDGTLQMFVEEAGEPDLSRLRFLRWLAEQGALEHQIAGPPGGALAVSPALASADPREQPGRRG